MSDHSAKDAANGDRVACSDPPCGPSVLARFGRKLHDTLPADMRQRLAPLTPLLVGTAGDGHDEARGYLALDWLVRTFTPAWLDLAGLKSQSEALRGLDQIVDLASARLAAPVVREIQEKVAIIRATVEDAAWVAAEDAAGAAAGAAAWVTAGIAVGDVAWAAAGPAAWVVGDAAWVTAGDAAWVAAEDAAGVAAGVAAADAAWVAAEDAAWVAAADAAGVTAADAAWVAAADAAWAKLTPTIRQLQNAVVDLYHRMITLSS